MMWLWGVILVLVMAVVETTAVPVELTAMVVAALGFRSGRAEMAWLAVWGGIVLGRGWMAMVVVWAVAVSGWAYRRLGGEPRWWAGLVLAVGSSGAMRWVTGNWSILGAAADILIWTGVWWLISFWQERWGNEMV